MHTAQRAEIERQIQAHKLVEKREIQSFEKQALKEERIEMRQFELHAPVFELSMKPPGRKEATEKAKNRHTSIFNDAHDGQLSEKADQDNQDGKSSGDDTSTGEVQIIIKRPPPEKTLTLQETVNDHFKDDDHNFDKGKKH